MKSQGLTRHARRVLLIVALVVVGGGTSLAAVPGTQLWVNKFGTSAEHPTSNALVPSPSGDSVFITGSLDYDYYTARLNGDTGNTIWASTYDSPVEGIDDTHGIAVSSDGTKVFITGESATADYFAPDFATVAMNAFNGAVLWVRRFDSGGGADVAKGVTVSADGSKVFVTGTATPPQQYADVVTIAYDAASGAELWRSTFDGPNGNDDLAVGIAASPSGHVYVTGTSQDYVSLQSWYDYFTVAYAASSGNEVWRRGYDGNYTGDTDQTKGLAVSPDGRTVFVTGTTFNGFSDDIGTLAYNAQTGARRWKKTYNGQYRTSDLASDLALSADGSRLYVTGQSSGPNGPDYITVAYQAGSGTKVWARRLGTSDSDYAYAIAVSPDGSAVYVTGRMIPSITYFDFITVGYEATTGSMLWIKRYSEPTPSSSDSAIDVGVSSDGSKVFVTGTDSPFLGLTVAYSAV